ncbi:MAG: preprotein translocase subunit YajC, partial [Clostridia bacterium]|nr:preprotein translocase subunit YajC [Clostridia bacterium]
KKRDQELAEKMQVGAEIITLGGLVGTIVEMDDQFFWIETGLGENKQVIKMVRQAYHSLVSELPAKDAQKKEDSDQDEIK